MTQTQMMQALKKQIVAAFIVLFFMAALSAILVHYDFVHRATLAGH